MAPHIKKSKSGESAKIHGIYQVGLSLKFQRKLIILCTCSMALLSEKGARFQLFRLSFRCFVLSLGSTSLKLTQFPFC